MAYKKAFAASKLTPVLLGLAFSVGGIEALSSNLTDLRPILTDPSISWASDTVISFQGSDEFLNATERWTVFRPPSYTAAVSPASEQDVRQVLTVLRVKLATSRNIPFLASGGRHGYTTTLGDLQNGLAIDLSQLKRLELNTTAQTITVGAGITIGEVFDPLYEAGFEIQTGTCPCPSLIGVTLGGGVGRFQGVYGLVLDALLSVNMVTAKGDLIEVSKESYSDLFWGLRGAGANFGIVTSATYQVQPLANNGDVLMAEFIFPANQSLDFFETVQSLNDRLPAELASISIIGWNSTTNETQLSVNWVYLGPEEEGRRALKPFTDLNPPVSSIEVLKYNRIVAETFGGIVESVCQGNIIRDLYSLNLKSYSAASYQESFGKMAEFFEQYPGGRNSILQFEFFPNQAMAAVAQEETAWPWRDATGYINPNMLWDEGDDETATAAMALGQELRRDLAATSGYPELSVFLNYARGDEKIEQIYGKEKLPRLAKLKKTWDPSHRFSFNNGLPTKYP
ncbi:hypothetical protein GGS23DRAFT_608303 [Durotheca rogersii]|uniref:uncharacterized protein n=1 Tax=Durotheca rogersii TaxID=419775 RepID=UPI00221F9EAE|nr:uncharacterized protein GGS23DRAFT_608303 [Durotheca rogersii]KAI5854497.1 hypothetical protein GGS23DRAFT_608303 [Durotheca rogersii]